MYETKVNEFQITHMNNTNKFTRSMHIVSYFLACMYVTLILIEAECCKQV